MLQMQHIATDVCNRCNPDKYKGYNRCNRCFQLFNNLKQKRNFIFIKYI